MSNREVRNVVRLKLNVPPEEFLPVAQECADFANTEPFVLVYDWYLAPDGETCDVFMSVRDCDAHSEHVSGTFGSKILPKLLAIADVIRSDVYGEVDNVSADFMRSRDCGRVYHGAPTIVAGTHVTEP